MYLSYRFRPCLCKVIVCAMLRECVCQCINYVNISDIESVVVYSFLVVKYMYIRDKYVLQIHSESY